MQRNAEDGNERENDENKIIVATEETTNRLVFSLVAPREMVIGVRLNSYKYAMKRSCGSYPSCLNDTLLHFGENLKKCIDSSSQSTMPSRNNG